MATVFTRARQARLPSPWTEAVDFLCFPQKPCTPMLNFFARSGLEIEKIDSLWTGRGIWKWSRAIFKMTHCLGARKIAGIFGA